MCHGPINIITSISLGTGRWELLGNDVVDKYRMISSSTIKFFSLCQKHIFMNNLTQILAYFTKPNVRAVASLAVL